MQNLDQIRAAAASTLCQKSEFDRADVAGFPSLIMNNGLLAATAYAVETGRGNRSGLAAASDGMARHLANPVHGIASLKNVHSGAELIQKLSTIGSSLELQRATAEALAFFAYVKRFAPNKAS